MRTLPPSLDHTPPPFPPTQRRKRAGRIALVVEEENEGEGREEESKEGGRSSSVCLAKLKLTPNLFHLSFSSTGKQHVPSSPSIIHFHPYTLRRRTRTLRRAEEGEPRDFASLQEEGCWRLRGCSGEARDGGEHLGRGYTGQGEVLLVWIGGRGAGKTGRTLDLDTPSPSPLQHSFTLRQSSPNTSSGPPLPPNRTLTFASSLSLSTYRHL